MSKAAYLTAVLLMTSACATKNAPTPADPVPGAPGLEAAAPEAPFDGPRPQPGVVVHLFEWRWDDVATECEAFLGPAGYAAVQVSPVTENSVVEGRPWWEKYQPVSYVLDNRSGDREAFADMVSRCAAAGVDVYVDAILNHMTGVYSGVGTAGSTFGEYSYPGLYEYDDFHHCGLTEDDDIEDFNDPEQVWTCELVNLADLASGQDDVRARLTAHLNDLKSLGVAGFRLDAAKHMHPADVAAVLSGVDDPGYVYQEVTGGGSLPDWQRPYYNNGRVTEFRFPYALGEVFKRGSLADLHGSGSIWTRQDFGRTDAVLVFVDNHDLQRSHADDVVTYKDDGLYRLAQVFALAYPYGRPRVMSSFAFEDGRQGPPSNDDGTVRRVWSGIAPDCGSGRWVCEHRWPEIVGAMQFNTAVGEVRSVDNWWTDGKDRIAFSRGDRGFVAINRSEAAMSQALQTGLAPGTYCDRLTREDDGSCAVRVNVAEDGSAVIRLLPMSAVAIDHQSVVALD
ncbi:MAG: ATPase [Rhodothermales bacterium]|nr:ATPase [Rhodothermales bacterium]